MPIYIAMVFETSSTNKTSAIIDVLNFIGPIITDKSDSLSCRAIILVKLFGHRDEPDESSFVLPPVLPHYQLTFRVSQI